MPDGCEPVYLLFPVEAPGVTVGDVDVAVRLEDGQLQTPQDGVEQLATGCLKAAMQRATFKAPVKQKLKLGGIFFVCSKLLLPLRNPLW